MTKPTLRERVAMKFDRARLEGIRLTSSFLDADEVIAEVLEVVRESRLTDSEVLKEIILRYPCFDPDDDAHITELEGAIITAQLEAIEKKLQEVKP